MANLVNTRTIVNDIMGFFFEAINTPKHFPVTSGTTFDHDYSFHLRGDKTVIAIIQIKNITKERTQSSPFNRMIFRQTKVTTTVYKKSIIFFTTFSVYKRMYLYRMSLIFSSRGSYRLTTST